MVHQVASALGCAATAPRKRGAQAPANAYGHFDASGSAFVIEDVLTPRPWINVLANDRYGIVLSQAGGGFSWAGNCQLFRLNRWEQDLVADNYGRWIYVQDCEAPDRVWSTAYMPTRIEADVDTVTHGLGQTTFSRVLHGIRTDHTVFVADEEPGERQILTVTNQSDQPRLIRFALAMEWHLGSIGDWHREFHRLFMESHDEGDSLYAWKHPGLEEHQQANLAEPIVAGVRWVGVDSVRWSTDKLAWLGRCGDPAHPAGLDAAPAGDRNGRWDDPIAAGVVEIALAPGETRTVALAIGAAVRAELDPWLASITVANSLNLRNEVEANWQARCGALEVDTPDGALNAMLNAWLPYQAIAGRLDARCAYYQQGGAYGYRDQLQDSLMLLATEPERTLVQLVRHAEAMYSDGGVRHWWHPDSEIFVESRHSDTCLWLAYGLLAYLDETADLAALNQVANYLDRAAQRPTGDTGSLLDHAIRGIERALDRRSPRGLPLIGAGDWNDGLSHAGLEGRGESAWLAMFLFEILTRLEPVLRRVGETDLADRYAFEAENLRMAVETHAWDGDRYIGGTRDDGRPFGARECESGSRFLNPQTWSAITGIGDPGRVRTALEGAKADLVTDFGALLLRPAYAQVDPTIGYITRYAPGLRENGGVYSHASTWAAWAYALVGDGPTAWRIVRGMLPPVRAAADAELYAAEPYVMPGNLDGPDSPVAGRAGWTWYTGSAAWLRRIAVEQILGVRATMAGLVIEPLLPPEWAGASLVRPFRGNVYRITLDGPGPYAMTVDGETHHGPLNLTPQSKEVKVHLTTIA